MKKQANISEINKKMQHLGLHINEKGEIIIIGERDGKEYKIGQAHQRIVSERELTKFAKKSQHKQERERES